MDRPATSSQDSGARNGRKILFSAMKNEAPFVVEWIAYHKAIGFDEIVICSNPSNDGTEEILAALAEQGEIRHLRRRPAPNQSPQGEASKAFTQEVGYRAGDWYLWLDADEFLNVHCGDRTVDALISAAGARSCIFVNWRIFGTSGNEDFPGRFVSPDFTGAAPREFRQHKHIKSLFRLTEGVAGFAVEGIHRPLLKPGNTIGLSDILTGKGKSARAPGQEHQRWLAGADSGRLHSTSRHETGWALAQINHYLVRTRTSFALKQARGRGWVPGAVGKVIPRHTDDFFALNDRNDEEDRSILYWQDAVTEEMARLHGLPGVAAAVEHAGGLMQQIMSGLALARAPEPVASIVPEDEPTVDPAPRLTFPPAEARFIRAVYPQAKVILEYGSGGSTMLAASLGARVISVESDKAWSERLAGHLAPFADRAKLHYVDIGPTGAWGKPSTIDRFARYHRYALSVWDRPDFEEPDLVLIDGRFRASCLVAVLLRARRPTTVLFDDYAERPYYHAVERLARKEEMIGRMARFTVTPGPIPPDMLTQAIGWFADMR